MMKDDDFKLFRGFDDRRTNGQTFAIVELLLRLKNFKNFGNKEYMGLYYNFLNDF